MEGGEGVEKRRERGVEGKERGGKGEGEAKWLEEAVDESVIFSSPIPHTHTHARTHARTRAHTHTHTHTHTHLFFGSCWCADCWGCLPRDCAPSDTSLPCCSAITQLSSPPHNWTERLQCLTHPLTTELF